MNPRPVSFAELVERHREELLGYLFRLLGNVHDAEDASQEAWLRACRAYDRLPPAANTRAWVYTIATRSGLNVLRRRARTAARFVAVDLDAYAASVATPEQGETLRRVAHAVHLLPPKQRAALMQRRFHGSSYEEIGAALACSATSARANVYQALRKLRAVMEGECHENT